MFLCQLCNLIHASVYGVKYMTERESVEQHISNEFFRGTKTALSILGLKLVRKWQ